MPGVLTETKKGGHFHLTQFINSLTFSSLTFKSPWEKREATFNLCVKKEKNKTIAQCIFSGLQLFCYIYINLNLCLSYYPSLRACF